MKSLFVLTVALVALVPGVAAAAAEKPPGTATHLSADQVRDLFSGKSWLWTNGAAYFAPNRTLIAWTGAGKTATYAAGSWRVTPLGRLCFDAVWHNTGYAGPVTTCFSHRIAGSTLYQAKEPAGPWYVFRHNPPQSGDEFDQLRPGDEVSAKYLQVRKALGAK